MAFDLDGFRAVNDRDGHAAGDLVLRRVADVLREESRDCDIAARIGGDEFLLVLPGVGGDGPAIAERVVAPDGGAHRRIAVCRRGAGAAAESWTHVC